MNVGSAVIIAILAVWVLYIIWRLFFRGTYIRHRDAARKVQAAVEKAERSGKTLTQEERKKLEDKTLETEAAEDAAPGCPYCK